MTKVRVGRNITGRKRWAYDDDNEKESLKCPV